MRNRFDQLGKKIGLSALGPSGQTVAHHEISPDARHADLRHEPDPSRGAERARLGLLGQIASLLCLIEIYGHAPDGAEFRACLGKHIAFWEQHARTARKAVRGEPFVDPFLWIVAAGRSDAVLAALKKTHKPRWPAGVYFCGDDVLRVGVVVASELPRDRSTLLVRLMAAGPLLPQAVEDLAALPDDAHERVVAEQILLDLRHVLGGKPDHTPEEQEFLVTMHSSWADARRMGRDEGRTEGRTDEAARAVLTVLRARGVVVPEVARERILAESSVERLERWLEKAAVAELVAEVLADPS
ncbi:MAG: hypothetical protein ABJE95_27985 [Byssovorax sp.]